MGVNVPFTEPRPHLEAVGFQCRFYGGLDVFVSHQSSSEYNMLEANFKSRSLAAMTSLTLMSD